MRGFPLLLVMHVGSHAGLPLPHGYPSSLLFSLFLLDIYHVIVKVV